MQDRALWQRIKDWPLTLAPSLSVRMNWSQTYADAVVREYRRFVYLAAISPTEVTPSTIVDEVWHRHLEDGDRYRAFCDGTLGRYLHHNPAAEGEETRMAVQYDRTRILYHREFGVRPPRNIWPYRGDKQMMKIGSGLVGSGLTLGLLAILWALVSSLPSLLIIAAIVMLAAGAMILFTFNPPARRKSPAAGCSGGGCGGGGGDGGGGCGGGGCGG